MIAAIGYADVPAYLLDILEQHAVRQIELEAVHAGGLRGVDALVVIAPRLGDMLQLLVSVHREKADLPIVLVTDSDPDNAAGLGHVLVDEVVWTTTAHEHLPRAIMQVRRLSLTNRWLRFAANGREKNAVLAQLAGVCQAGVPIPNVSSFAGLCCMSESQLNRRVKREFGVTTKCLLDGLRLLVSIDLARDGSTEQAARAIGIDPVTLHRMAVRLTRHTFAELRKDPERGLEAVQTLLTRTRQA